VNWIADATNRLSDGIVVSINLEMAIQNETKSASETCRLIADQMRAEAELEPERNQMLMRAAQAWSELANSLKRGEAAKNAEPRISSIIRPRSEPIVAEVDGATFIARW
jgi:hypothetical protein